MYYQSSYGLVICCLYIRCAFSVPTFRDFLLTIESPSAVEDYVQEYLGDSKEARDFAADFIRKTRSADRPQSNHRPETQPNPSNQSNNNFQEVKVINYKCLLV